MLASERRAARLLKLSMSDDARATALALEPPAPANSPATASPTSPAPKPGEFVLAASLCQLWNLPEGQLVTAESFGRLLMEKNAATATKPKSAKRKEVGKRAVKR